MDKIITQQKILVKKLERSFMKDRAKSTVAEMQKDYANDDQICLASVVFLPSAISKIIKEKIIKRLKKIELQHYYFPPQSMHITIKNVRTIQRPPLFSDSDVKKVNDLFKRIIPQHRAFDFQVEDVLLFPTSVSVMAYSDHNFQQLVKDLDRGLRQIGVPDNKKYLSKSLFFGNSTICRFSKKPGKEMMREIGKIRKLKIGRFKVDKIKLVASNIVFHPKKRRVIGEYALGK